MKYASVIIRQVVISAYRWCKEATRGRCAGKTVRVDPFQGTPQLRCGVKLELRCNQLVLSVEILLLS